MSGVDPVAAGEATILLFMTIGVRGGWDGLRRRHVRLTFDVLDMDINLRGIFAILVGTLCALILLLTGQLTGQRIVHEWRQCPTWGCMLQRNVLPAFTDWRTALAVLVIALLFVVWARGAFDKDGPYKSYLLAPDVWYREKDLLVLVARNANQQHLTPNERDHILRLAMILRHRLRLSWKLDPSQVLLNGTLDASSLARIYLGSSDIRRIKLTPKLQRVAVETFLKYYLDRHADAVRKWPWRAKLLRY